MTQDAGSSPCGRTWPWWAADISTTFTNPALMTQDAGVKALQAHTAMVGSSAAEAHISRRAAAAVRGLELQMAAALAEPPHEGDVLAEVSMLLGAF